MFWCKPSLKDSIGQVTYRKFEFNICSHKIEYNRKIIAIKCLFDISYKSVNNIVSNLFVF